MKIKLSTLITKDGITIRREKMLEVTNVTGLIRCVMLDEATEEKVVLDDAARALKFPKKELKKKLIAAILEALEPIDIEAEISVEYISC